MWLLALAMLSLSWRPVSAENVINVMLISSLDMREILESVPVAAGNKEMAALLRNQLQGQLFTVNAQVDLKSLKLALSLRESSLSVVLPDCSMCLAAKRNDTSVEKFAMIYRLKCLALRDNRDCTEYTISGRHGHAATTNINFGYLGFDLKDTRLVKSVSSGDPLTTIEAHGIIGVGPSDLEGNFETSFLRTAQEEADISFSSVEMSFLAKNMSLAIGSGERMRTGDDHIWRLKDNTEISVLVNKLTLGDAMTVIDLEETFLLDTTVINTRLDKPTWNKLLSGLRKNPLFSQSVPGLCLLMAAGAASLNETHICESWMWTEPRSFDLQNFLALKPANQEVGLLVQSEDSTSPLRMKYLFVISPDSSVIEQELPSDRNRGAKTFKLRFAFELGERNTLGMNLLDYKTFRVDYQSLQAQISQCPDGTTDCEYEKVLSDAASERQIKVITEIASFISLIGLIFAGIISYDKYVNEEEYMKE